MKSRLGKVAVNISKLTGGKIEKARRGVLHGKLRLDLYFVYRKHWLEIKIIEYVVCRKKRLSNWNFITYIQCTADRSNLLVFIYFYYSQIVRTFCRSFYCFVIHIQTFFKWLWCHGCKNNSSHHIRKLYKTPNQGVAK